MRKISLLAMLLLLACASSRSDRAQQQHDAIIKAKKRIQLESNSSNWIELGNAFLKVQALDSALHAFNKALSLKKGAPGAVCGKAIVHWHQDKKKEALAEFRSVLYSAQADSFVSVIASKVGCPFQITRLDLSGSDNAFPACSPVDDRIAFQSQRQGNWDIYLYSPQTLETTRITRDPAREGAPVFTDNGNALVYTSTRNDTLHTRLEVLSRDLYQYDLATREEIRLTDHPADDWSPKVSPDGKWLAFLSTRDDTGGFDESYSRPFIMNRETAALSAITWEPMQYVLGGYHPSGAGFTFSGKQDDYNLELYIHESGNMPDINLDGSVMAGDWSPDGKQLVFYRAIEDQLDCFMHDLQTQKTQQLTCWGSLDAHPVYAADQKSIYFHSNRSGKFQIYRMDLQKPIERETLLETLDHLSDRFD
jgi:TolB protein